MAKYLFFSVIHFETKTMHQFYLQEMQCIGLIFFFDVTNG